MRRGKRDSRGRQTKSGGLAAGGLASLGARHLLQPRVPHGAGTAPTAPCHPPGTLPHPARGWGSPPCHPQPLCCAGSGLEPSGWSIPHGLTLSLCPPHSCPSPPWQLCPIPCGSGGVHAGAEPPQGLSRGGPACSSSLPTSSDPSASSGPTRRRVTCVSRAGGIAKTVAGGAAARQGVRLLHPPSPSPPRQGAGEELEAAFHRLISRRFSPPGKGGGAGNEDRCR